MKNIIIKIKSSRHKLNIKLEVIEKIVNQKRYGKNIFQKQHTEIQKWKILKRV